MTPQREKRFREVLEKRQPGLTAVFEGIDDPHNIAACLRTCDAVGITEVYILSPKDKKISKLGKKSSASATKWINIHHFNDVKECFAALRKKYSKIYATRLTDQSINIYEIDFKEKVAVVFGNEQTGISDETAALCDGSILIPQVGMIQSLNVSVACAITLYEAFRQRLRAGMYNEMQEPQWIDQMMEKWKTLG